MAKVGKVATARWQNFDPTKTKLTKNQKEALKRKELRAICDEYVKSKKLKYAFYEVNWSVLGDYNSSKIMFPKTVKTISWLG